MSAGRPKLTDITQVNNVNISQPSSVDIVDAFTKSPPLASDCAMQDFEQLFQIQHQPHFLLEIHPCNTHKQEDYVFGVNHCIGGHC